MDSTRAALNDQNLLPVTVLSGFLGAGKTSLLKYLLQNQDDMRLAVIVNDMAEVNIDAALIKSGSTLVEGKDKLVEMQNGCICCTLRPDLIENVGKLAAEKRFEYLLIESTGISEPMPVAITFAPDNPVRHSAHDHMNFTYAGKMLSEVARLDTLVTVVDAVNFLKDYQEGAQIKDRPDLGSHDSDPRAIADLLVDQVECANLLVLNKMDLIAADDATRLEGVLRRLNPKANIVHSTFGRIDPKLLLNTGSFNLKEAEKMPGWIQELTGNHVPETLEYNISSFIYRAKRPFHPARMHNLQSSGSDGILRSKGIIWVADSPQQALTWGQAGVSVRIEAGSLWVHESMDASQWPPVIRDRRRQEIVFIGIGLDEVAIRKRLEIAFVTGEELKSSMRVWHEGSQTFPIGHLLLRSHLDGHGKWNDTSHNDGYGWQQDGHVQCLLRSHSDDDGHCHGHSHGCS